jgi:hypothetical protein
VILRIESLILPAVVRDRVFVEKLRRVELRAAARIPHIIARFKGVITFFLPVRRPIILVKIIRRIGNEENEYRYQKRERERYDYDDSVRRLAKDLEAFVSPESGKSFHTPTPPSLAVISINACSRDLVALVIE